MFGLDTTPLTERLLKTNYDTYECNTLMLLINSKNVTKEEVSIIKSYNEKQTLLVDMNIEERTIDFKDHKVDLNRLIHQCKLMCSGIDSDFLVEEMRKCKLVFLLFSRKLPNITLRDPKVIDKMCGLLLLNPEMEHLYISVICANKGKGGQMLSFAEYIADKLHKSKVKLSSLDTPFPFYIKNNYRIDGGHQDITIGDDEPEELLELKSGAYYRAPTNEDIEKYYLKPYLGIVYSKNRKHWIYVGDPDVYQRDKWFYIKPGYVVLYNRIQDEGRVYFERNPIFRGNDEAFYDFISKSHNITKYRVQDKDGNKVLLNGNAGVISELKNVSIKSMEFIQMTKDLSKYPVTYLSGKNRKNKTKKKNRKRGKSKRKKSTIKRY